MSPESMRVPKETTIEVVVADELHTYKAGTAVKPDDPGAEAVGRALEALEALPPAPEPESPATSAPQAGAEETDR